MSMSYDDCQDISRERDREEREDEIRQRLLGPIGLRPQEGGPRMPLRELAKKCVIDKARELRDAAILAEGYSFQHAPVGDPDTSEEYEAGKCWVIVDELFEEFDELLDDLNTIEKEGW